ncbi:arginase family protein [Collinsella aerofaciens]|uniref:arginase family protein n=1 Tax=Collinsella aerofaciens TaxID=74426 RepID=UPI003982CE32
MKRVPKLGHEKWEAVRIYAEDEVLAGIQDAQRKLTAENPDRVVTVGGNCMVSLALFDYLHGKYENVGIVWIYAHPDVSTLNDGYPNAHAMVLGSLLGESHPGLRRQITRMSAGRLQPVRGEAGRRKQDSSTRARR